MPRATAAASATPTNPSHALRGDVACGRVTGSAVRTFSPREVGRARGLLSPGWTCRLLTDLVFPGGSALSQHDSQPLVAVGLTGPGAGAVAGGDFDSSRTCG